MFLTTHYMEEAEYLADHIAVIFKGKIIAEGTLEDLIRRYGKSSILHIKKCKNATEVIEMLKQEGYDEVSSEGNGDIAIKIDYKERVLGNTYRICDMTALNMRVSTSDDRISKKSFYD